MEVNWVAPDISWWRGVILISHDTLKLRPLAWNNGAGGGTELVFRRTDCTDEQAKVLSVLQCRELGLAAKAGASSVDLEPIEQEAAQVLSGLSCIVRSYVRKSFVSIRTADAA